MRRSPALGFALVLAALVFTQCRSSLRPPPPIPANGVTDATAAIQKKLDALKESGGQVTLPPGLFLIEGTLKVPSGVALRGSWIAPHDGAGWNKGTTLLLTAGQGDENGAPAITLSANSALNGLTLLWPEQMCGSICPYPWAIHGIGEHVTVENVTLVNAYQGIWVGSPDGSLHLLRNIFGCVLRRGIFIDGATDIGRIENVHFNPHYWLRSNHASLGKVTPELVKTLQDFEVTHLEAFIFGRSDWEYSFNTFVWGAKCGYHFIRTANGSCEGQFSGMGADYCQRCVQIDTIQPVGLQITSGQFTAFAGGPDTAIITSPFAGGTVQMVDCNFYATPNHSVWMQGETAVILADCHFMNTPVGGAVLAERGKLIMHGCIFDQPGLAVALQRNVSAAVMMGNLQPTGFHIRNEMGQRAQIGFNQSP